MLTHTEKLLSLLFMAVLLMLPSCAAMSNTSSVATSGSDLPAISDGVVSRAITAENRTGEPGQGGKTKKGRKGSSFIANVRNGETATLMDVAGCGVIRHIWITVSERSPAELRNQILRMYWDGSAVPSVEVPLSDFFGTAHGRAVPLTTAFTTMTVGKGFNCYFAMPFATHAKITVHNDMPDNKALGMLFFQIDYELRERLPSNTPRFHAQFRRQNPTVPKQDFVLLDNVEGPGYFLGCVLGVRALGPNWWGEGEMKFYIDDDTEYPTICGTGTEDYFGAAWGMGLYQTPYHGCTLLLKNDFFKHDLVSMYRFHEKDPVYFRRNLKATIQQIGWNKGLFERSDDWCSVAYWYQMKPVKQMPPLPDRAARIADIIEPPAK